MMAQAAEFLLLMWETKTESQFSGIDLVQAQSGAIQGVNQDTEDLHTSDSLHFR